MRDFDNRPEQPGRGKQKRFPVLSIALIVGFAIATIIYFASGIGSAPGRVVPDDSAAQSPVESSPMLTPSSPDTTTEALQTPTPMPPAVKVKGIYYNVWFPENDVFSSCVELIETTELNAMVIDIKEDHGFITFQTGNELLDLGTEAFLRSYRYYDPIPNEAIEDLNSRGIYTIARVVCFKDDLYAGENPGNAIQSKSGGVWRDRNNERWLDPYNRDNWEYIAEICREAAKLGFQEIQLDYVRFPLEGNLSNIDYGVAAEEHNRYQIINEFVAYIREEMISYGVRTSADIFGIVGISNADAGMVGQNVQLLLGSLDSICPMIYPSHFSNEAQNGVGQVINGITFPRPDVEPYEVVYHSLQHYKRHAEQFANNNPGVKPAIIRPYLQSFTADWLSSQPYPDGFWILYTAEEVRAQIEAVYDAGFDEWILWRSFNNLYTADIFAGD